MERDIMAYTAQKEMWIVYENGETQKVRKGQTIQVSINEGGTRLLASLGSFDDCSKAYRKWREIVEMQNEFFSDIYNNDDD